MAKEFPTILWARYADDGITHCTSLKQAKYLQRRLQERFAGFGLELNLEKTRIVYCKDDDRTGNHEHTSFDFLGYTFRPRYAKNKYGKFFTNFLPAMGEKAKKSIRKEVRGWKLQLKPDKELWDIANIFNRQIQGWINYYTHFYKSEIYEVLRYINGCLVDWVLDKPKGIKYLGFGFYWDVFSHQFKAKPHMKSMQKLKEKLKLLTSRSWGVSTSHRIMKVKQLIVGWVNYFKIGQMKSICREVDAHIRFRLRMCIWKQWKKVKTKA
jgi:hypothetical protein